MAKFDNIGFKILGIKSSYSVKNGLIVEFTLDC